MKEAIAFFLILGFISGVAFASLHLEEYVAEFLFAPTIIAGAILYWLARNKSHRPKILAFICAVVLGASHVFISNYFSPAGRLDECLGKKISFRGLTVADPSISEKNVGLVIKILDYKSFEEKCAQKELFEGMLVRVQYPLYPVFFYGDEVSVKGAIKAPENFSKEGSTSSFDYVGYLASQGIYYLIDQPHVSFVGHDQGNFVVGALQKIKRNFVAHIESTFAQPHGALVAGLLLGIKSSLGKDLQEDFRRVGLVHIIVLSGSNVTLIAQTIIAAFAFLPRLGGAVAALTGITLFAFLAGTSPTVVRASVMASLAVCASLVWREYSVFRALLCAAVAMVLLNPQLVIFDPSFQLSFLATLGLILLSPIVERWFAWVPDRFGMREVLVSSISTQIFMTPFLLFLMGQVSVVSLVVNIVVLPLVPYAMLFGFLGAVFSYIHPIFALPFAGITHLLLSFIFWIVQKHSRIPFASVSIETWGIWQTIFSYLIFSVWYWWFIKRKSKPPSLPSQNSPQSPPS